MRIAAVILAAGASSRFGKPKPLAQFRGEALVRRAVRAATIAGCTPVCVVTGEASELWRSELADCPAVLIPNPDWSEGIASSIRAGVQHAQENEAVLLMTCDQPLVDADALRQLIDLRLTSGKPIVAAAYAKTIGIPALFDRSFFPELLRLLGDEGAKSILLAHREEVAEFSFPDAAIDVDTPGDLEQLER